MAENSIVHFSAEAHSSARKLSVAYSHEELKTDLLEVVRSFNDTILHPGMAEVLGKDLISFIRHQEGEIRKRLEGAFSLAVVGDFKRGKSTLINALLGETVVTTDVTPETVTINRIHYGEEYEIRACMDNGGTVKLERNDLKREHLERIARKFPSNLKYLSIAAPCEFLKVVELIDTPGLGDLFNQFDARVRQYLRECDALIYVISCLSPLSQSEQIFLRTAVLPQEFPKLVIVANMIDAVKNDDEENRLLQSIRDKVGDLFPCATVLPVSSLDEVCRIRSLARPNPGRADALSERFQTFRNAIHDSILLHRHCIMAWRACKLFETVLLDTEKKVALLREAMQSDQDRLAGAIHECENESSSLHCELESVKENIHRCVESMSQQTQEWMGELLTRLEREISESLAGAPYDDLRKHFHFYMMDVLQDAIAMCVKLHESAISKLAAKSRAAVAKQFSDWTPAGVDSLQIAQSTFGEIPWKGTDTVLFAIDFLTSGPLVDALFGYLRESNMERKSAEYVRSVQQSFPQLKNGMREQLRNSYSRIASEIVEQIEAAYQKDMQSCLDAMYLAQELHSKGTATIEVCQERCSEIMVEVEKYRAFLAEFREKLWQDEDVSA